MGDSGGHFENGRWVEDSRLSPEPDRLEESIESRLRSAAGQIGKGVDELLSAGSDLINTQEGRKALGKTLDGICGDILKTCDEIRQESIEFINQARDRFMK